MPWWLNRGQWSLSFFGGIVYSGHGGPHSTMDSVLASHPAAMGSILHVPKNNSMMQRFIDSPAENRGQRLDNGNRTHLVLASGKLVLQTKNSGCWPKVKND